MKKKRIVKIFRVDIKNRTWILIPRTFFLGTKYGRELVKNKRLGAIIIEPTLETDPTPEIVWDWIRDKSMPLFWVRLFDFDDWGKKEYLWQLN